MPVLVGVIDGEDRGGCARRVGRELTKRGCVVLTRGGARDGRRNSASDDSLAETSSDWQTA